MKRIFTVITIALGMMLPMQAQIKPITKEIKKDAVERNFKKKTVAASDITINDLVGTFEAYAMSAFQDEPDEQWKVTVTLDETEANKIWIQPIMQIYGFNLSEISPIYATYSQENSTITIPLGQSLYAEGNNMNIVLASSDENYNPVTTGEITLPVSGTVKNIVITAEMLLGCGDILNEEGWWYQALAYTTYTKAAPVPTVYITAKDNESLAAKVKAEQLYFVEYENEIYVSTTPEYTPDAVAGTYEVYAQSAFQNEPDEEWTITITRDEADKNKVWIHPIMIFGGLYPEDINPIYGTFDESASTITIPLGQTLFSQTGYTFIMGSVDNNYNTVTEGNLTVTVVNDGEKFIEIPYIIGVGCVEEGDNGWWYQALGYTTLTSVEPLIAPISEIGTISREMEIPEVDGYFNEGTYKWSFTFTDNSGSNPLYTITQHTNTGNVIDLGDFYGEGAAGVMAQEWDINGFLADTNIFAAGTPASFKGYSYKFAPESEEFEFLDLLDPQMQPVTIGSTTLNDGQTDFVVDLYLGDYDSQAGSIYYNMNFVVDGDKVIYGGTGLVLWFVLDNQAYLLGQFDNVTINREESAKARKSAAQLTLFDQPIAVKQAGVKKAMFNK